MAQVEVRKFVGYGYETGRRRMVTVIGKPICVLAFRRIRLRDDLNIPCLCIPGIECFYLDLVFSDLLHNFLKATVC